jgi:hypothetical protein
MQRVRYERDIGRHDNADIISTSSTIRESRDQVSWLMWRNCTGVPSHTYNTMTTTEGINHDFFEPSNFLPISLPGRLEVRTEVGWSMVKIKIITTQLDPKNALKL